MPPMQRVVGSPDLITAPDRFPDGLASWRNPSQGGTLGHYVTPDAPAGVSTGLATAAPRDELPAPARPWWWPQPAAVQRHVPTPLPEPLISFDDPAPAVPVHPLPGHNLVSAAGIEPSTPRLVLPAVQRHATDPEAGQAPVPDPDLPAGESPPEAPLPSVMAAPTEPLSEISAGSRPDNRASLPAARRLGLGAPLQRVPDLGHRPWTDAAPVQRQTEVDAEPTDVAPLVSDIPPMAPSTPSATEAPSTPTSPSPQAVQRALDTPLHGDSHLAQLPSTESTTPPLPTPANTEPPAAQRQVEPTPLDVAPLVSDTPPMASVVTSPKPPDAVACPPIAAPPATAPPATAPAATAPLVGAPSAATAGPSSSPLSAQRTVDAPPPPDPHPAWRPEIGTTATTPLSAAADSGPSTVHRAIAAEAMEVAPLVSGSPSMTPSTPPAAESPSITTSPAPQAVQRALDTPPLPDPHPAWRSEIGTTAAAPLPAAAGRGPSTVHRAVAVDAMEVAPLVSDSALMPPVVTSPMPLDDGVSPPAHSAQPAAESSTAQRQVEPTPLDIAPLVSGTPPMASVLTSSMPADPVAISPATPSPAMTPPVAIPLATIPSVTAPSAAVIGPSRAPVSAQRAVDTTPPPGPHPAWRPEVETTTAAPLPAATGTTPPTVQRRIETAAAPLGVAPLVSDSAPIPSVVTSPIPSGDAGVAPLSPPPTEPATRSRSTATSPSPQSVQRRVEIAGEPTEVAPLVSGSPPIASMVIPFTDAATGSPSAEQRPSPGVPPSGPGLTVQRAVDAPPGREPRPVWSFPAEPTAPTSLPAEAVPAEAEPSTVHRAVAVETMEVAPLVSDSALMPPVVPSPMPLGDGTSSPAPSAQPAAESRFTGTNPSPQPLQRAVYTPLRTGPHPRQSPSAEPTLPPLPTATSADTVTAQRQVEPTSLDVAPLVSDTPPMASVVTPPMPSGNAESPPASTPTTALTTAAVPSTVHRAVAIDTREIAPLVSGSALLASVLVPSTVTPSADAVVGSRSAGSSPSPQFVQRAVDAPRQRESTDLTAPAITHSPPLSYADHTGSHHSVAPTAVGLVGDRPIEPAVAGYPAAVDSAGGPVAAPAVERTRWPAVQRHGTVESQVAALRAPVTAAVQRGIHAGTASWPPGAFTPELVVQRADAEPAAATDLPAATDLLTATDLPTATDAPAATDPGSAPAAAPGAPPAAPAGSTSPTEVDALVRRLYDPIVRRLKAELQLDRERAGRSLDLWH